MSQQEAAADRSGVSEQEQKLPPWLIPQQDPNAPHRNMSPFLLYQESVREQVKRDNPDFTFLQIAKYISKSYSELSTTEEQKWLAKAEADKSRYLDELAAYDPPPGFDNKGDVIVVEPTHKKGRPVTKQENQRDMKVIIAQSGVQVTKEDSRLQVFMFPRENGKHQQDRGEPFSDWAGIFKYPEPTDQDTYLKHSWMEDHLYDGYRVILESMLRRDWERMSSDFKQIPETAKWSIQRVEGSLMSILQDENHVYLLSPTSAECVSRIHELTMPTPFIDRDDKAGPGHYMNHDVWFEDCGDGGVYIIGLEEKVLLFYVDGPGDMVMNRWQCHKDQWESMWLSAFGTVTVKIDQVNNDSSMIG
eukprot:CAMPEP_0195289528 /NCGR_PEP_ID=MMETSP0707-20130614/5768_1 /TAXON_ID=33640 /ORGANISM="Asterionellopsis glacialis, Strain CCMP134" /LENGTH=359 /DNA_ID=CAMNT_0040349545 /DNA_START=71 /DNA_END=1150 /DNA_ORIENTATION=-